MLPALVACLAQHADAVPEVASSAAGGSLGAQELSLLAVIQGLTEFLPISSSGHLAIAGNVLDEGGAPLWIEVALHLGTLAAVLMVYRVAVLDAVVGFFTGRPREGLCVILGTLPVVVVGFLVKDVVEELTADRHFVGYGLLVTATILSIGEWARRRNLSRERADRGTQPPEPTADRDATGVAPDDLGLSYGAAFLIGLAQTVAILPGISRSGTTISAGLLCGLSPGRAARFSFLLSIPAILGACILTAKDAQLGGAGELGPTVVLWSMALAGLVGWAALRVLIAFLARGAFLWFTIYCVLLGVGVFAFL